MTFKTLLVCFLLLVGSVIAALLIGQVHLSFSALWQGLFGEGPGAFTLRYLRGPRVAVALGTGAALGLAGAVFQQLLRNPLASPDVMGFSSGAGLAILTAVTFNLALPMPLVAAIGGFVTAAAVFRLARPSGEDFRIEGTPPIMLVLVGIGVGSTFSAIGYFLVTRLSPPEAAEAQRWLAGSLAARSWGHAFQVLLTTAILALCLVPQVRALRLLELGSDLAVGLGLRLARARVLLAATGVALAAAAVAVAGPVSFVALMAPPLGARLCGARDPGSQLAAAAFTGAMIVLWADLVARASLPGLQLPIGVMTGLMGAPYLLWCLSREMKKGTL